jgi:hypothetical protein
VRTGRKWFHILDDERAPDALEDRGAHKCPVRPYGCWPCVPLSLP